MDVSSQEQRPLPARPRVRRRQTLSSFPATPPDDERTQQHQQQNRESGKRHSRVASSSSSSVGESHESATGSRGRRLPAWPQSDAQSTTLVGHTTTSVGGPVRRLGRTPSSPSVLLSKVKERIREKVSQKTGHCLLRGRTRG